MVLLKDFDERGFVFYYKSHKGAELEKNPQAALVFWWAELERKVRISGHVEKLSNQSQMSISTAVPSVVARWLGRLIKVR